MSKIRTASGRLLDVANPDPDDILIEDIARGLSNACRFGGQLPDGQWRSVAAHSVDVSMRVSRRDWSYALEALLHDASEAYICDIPSPVKALLPDYQALERNLQAAIYRKFGVAGLDSKGLVARADVESLTAEYEVAYFLSRHQARRDYAEFMRMFRFLTHAGDWMPPLRNT